MTQIKITRIERLNKQLLDLEAQADAQQFDIDAVPEWVAITALIIAYEDNERHYTDKFIREFNDLLQEVSWLIFLHWAELYYGGQI